MFLLPDEKKSAVKFTPEVLPSMKVPKDSRVVLEESLPVACPAYKPRPLFCGCDSPLSRPGPVREAPIKEV